MRVKMPYLLTCAVLLAVVVSTASTVHDITLPLVHRATRILQNNVTSRASMAEELALEAKSKQEVLNKVIDDVLIMNNMEYHGDGPDISRERVDSLITGICEGLPERMKNAGEMDRAGCHAPKDTRHLYNVKIEGPRIILFRDSNSIEEFATLPPIRSLTKRHGSKAMGATAVRPFNFNCSDGIFRGTLHVLGVQTTNNVYHVISDNYVPVISQILLDAYSQSPYLKLPRMAVFHGSLGTCSRNDHCYLQRSLFSAGVKTWKELDGLCFQRVIWGWGPHTNFFFHMFRQRRMASDFARLHASVLFPLTIPEEWSGENTDKSTKAVLFTRGSSGRGRSMKNEALILRALRDKTGILAEICCDYHANNSLEVQLRMAYHADIVLGLHGAGLVHSIFSRKGVTVLELKTLYAFESVLMAMIADSRQGVHIQVDVRSYFVKGGHKPVDEPLALSVTEALKTADKLGIGGNQTSHTSLHVSDTGIYASVSPAESKGQRGFLITRHTIPSPSLSHFLGPAKEELVKECQAMEVMSLSKILHGHLKSNVYSNKSTFLTRFTLRPGRAPFLIRRSNFDRTYCIGQKCYLYTYRSTLIRD